MFPPLIALYYLEVFGFTNQFSRETQKTTPLLIQFHKMSENLLIYVQWPRRGHLTEGVWRRVYCPHKTQWIYNGNCHT